MLEDAFTKSKIRRHFNCQRLADALAKSQLGCFIKSNRRNFKHLEKNLKIKRYFSQVKD